MKISQAASEVEVQAARDLFEEYAADIGVDLCFQDFAAELAGLPGLYGPPHGRLLIAWSGTDPAGCVALRPLDGPVCEMKRMYVRPAFRMRGLARQLTEMILQEARCMGYAAMKLDTLPTMLPAIRLYESLGFVRCGPYYDTPLPETIFMECRLKRV